MYFSEINVLLFNVCILAKLTSCFDVGEVGESSSENNESDAEGNEDLHNTCTTELQRAEGKGSSM